MRYIEACQSGTWHLHLWPLGEDHGDGTECQRLPYTCRSWRHEGECRDWRNNLDFWRVLQGIKSRGHWVYCVLTFQQGTAEERYKTYYKAGRCWDLLRKRLIRLSGKLSYVQTWERHAAGGCHCNVLLSNPDIAFQVQQDWRKWRRHSLRPNAVASGFGPVCWVERCDDQHERIAGYLVKKASELVLASNKEQTPYDAPPHFRRIRASRGLLPRKPDPEFSGQLVKVPVPEYNYSVPAEQQPCGCHGSPHAKKGEEQHATHSVTVGESS